MLYAANYVSKNKGSISAMVGADMPKNLDIFTYSFPCQDISVAGKMIGFDKDSGSRSSLVWQILRILDEAKKIGRLPKVLLMENVKALFSSKFISDWIAIKDILNDLGYDSFDTTINAIDKGSIQSRERVFSVAILRNGNLSNKFFFNNNIIKNSLVINDILSHKMKLDTYDKHFAQETNYTFQPSLDKYLLKRFYTKKSGIKVSKLVGYSVYNMSNLVYHPMGKCPTILADGGNSKLKILNMQTKTIRLLTPLETWRLMGFDLNDYINLISEWNHNDIINKATKKNYKISKHNLYKLAGNSIVIEVLEDIFSDILGKVFDILYDL
jgi:DNA (cytosine-5)-methyltransferase 1